MNDTIPTEGTMQFVAMQIAKSPGLKHSYIVEGDRESQARRRSALLILQERGIIVRSNKRPFRYWLASQLQSAAA